MRCRGSRGGGERAMLGSQQGVKLSSAKIRSSNDQSRNRREGKKKGWVMEHRGEIKGIDRIPWSRSEKDLEISRRRKTDNGGSRLK